MKVLFVCTGNVCRSPMGELLLPKYIPDLESDSAGTRGLDNHKIAQSSAKLMTAHGIDSSAFRSKRITPQLANSSGLILCFEHEQRNEIAIIAPIAAHRTFLINDFANMCAYWQRTRLYGRRYPRATARIGHQQCQHDSADDSRYRQYRRPHGQRIHGLRKLISGDLQSFADHCGRHRLTTPYHK